MKEKRTLIKALPLKRKYESGGASTELQSMLLFSRDESGEKYCEYIDRTKSSFYILKDQNAPERRTQPTFIEKDKVERVECYTDLLYRTIAEKANANDYFSYVQTSKGERASEMKNLFKHPVIYDADTDTTDRYIAQFHEMYDENPSYPIYKCFFDIEVDLLERGLDDKGYMGFPDEELAPCPVNIITLIDGQKLESYHFILRNSKNTSLKNFEVEYTAAIERVRKKLKDKENLELNGIHTAFYNTEFELIKAFFERVHEIDPDYMIAWNECFDVKTLINRLQKLVSKNVENFKDTIYEVAKIVSNPKYIHQKTFTGEDIELFVNPYYSARKDTPIVDRIDSFTVLDGTIWLDAMLVFANIRKSKLRDSYALDAIATEELKFGKQEFGPGETIKNLAWLNFEKFFMYNLRDVILLHLLEKKNLDMDMIQRLSEITNTRAEKVLKKTISLKNFMNKFAVMQGFIIGNNKNATYGSDQTVYRQMFRLDEGRDIKEADQKYRDVFAKRDNFGAFVSNPLLNNPLGDRLFGVMSKYIFLNVFDEDFSALYPSILRAFNLSTRTMIGKFFLIDEVHEEKLIKKYGYETLFAKSANDSGSSGPGDLGIVLADAIQSRNYGKIGEEFFDLPSLDEMITELNLKKKIDGTNI